VYKWRIFNRLPTCRARLDAGFHHWLPVAIALTSKIEVKRDDQNGHNRGAMSSAYERITIDPAICHGKPTIRGLRYPVEMILELLSSGMTHQEILDDYPDLEPEDILAVLEFAARVVRTQRIEPLAA
jgi:uncharacterized protein (DUF433 family)